jgi:signal transduction histidine kinase
MKVVVKFRLVALGVVIALVGALIAFTLFDSQRQSQDLRARLGSVDSESDEIAAHFKDAMREVNNLRFQYEIGHDPTLWNQFLQVSGELKHWIDDHGRGLTTPEEKGALEAVRTAYDDYLAKTTKVGPLAGPSESPASVAAFIRVRAESQRLFDLGQALARAHYESRNQVLAYANLRLKQMRLTILGLLGLLFIFGAALAAVAYRDMIAPLRLKLVESQSMVERQEKLAALGMLAAGVAHEIRNPLTAIKAALFLQKKGLKSGSPQSADAEVVEREILRLERIVNDFLRFARPAEPDLALVPAQQPLDDVQRLFAAEFAAAGIRLVLESSVADSIRVDVGQIEQVLINLVKNAAESIGRNGTITLRSRRDRVALAQRETEVVILEVADTGKGISPQVGKRLFDPFFTTKDDGTGLGLSIAARIVEKHGGALQYRSRPNHGSTFGVVLPVDRR